MQNVINICDMSFHGKWKSYYIFRVLFTASWSKGKGVHLQRTKAFQLITKAFERLFLKVVCLYLMVYS